MKYQGRKGGGDERGKEREREGRKLKEEKVVKDSTKFREKKNEKPRNKGRDERSKERVKKGRTRKGGAGKHGFCTE